MQLTNIVTAQPAEEPITLAEMRAQIGVTRAEDTARDAIIINRIKTARLWCEAFTRRAFVTQEITGYADSFHSFFDLRCNLQSVTSVNYIDSAGVNQVLAPNQYLVDTVHHRVHPAYGVSWPATRDQPNAVWIVYQAGYGLISDVPEDVKDALKFIVGQWENYQETIEGGQRPMTIPNAAKQLLNFHVDTRNIF